jgi:3'(2'), 5'-bisphosphate nucleotidase
MQQHQGASPDLSTLLNIAIGAALDAGKAVLDVYSSDFAVEHKDDRSPLTLADKRSHEVIAARLSRSDAGGYPLLSEEGRNIPFDERGKWKVFWLVDPVDGTKEFIKRNGEFTVNIALIRGNRPVLGVIYVPVRDALYHAAEGAGAYRLEKASEVLGEAPGIAPHPKALRLPTKGGPARLFTIVASRSHRSPETEGYLQALAQKHGETSVISAGSSLKFCLVAEGQADIYPRFAPTMEWDIAAGHVIVEEAGGVVVNSEDYAPMVYNKQDLTNGWFIAAAAESTVLRVR